MTITESFERFPIFLFFVFTNWKMENSETLNQIQFEAENLLGTMGPKLMKMFIGTRNKGVGAVGPQLKVQQVISCLG